MSNPNLYELIDAAKIIMKQIAGHPEFKAMNYHPDLTIGDAQTALSYLKYELEGNRKYQGVSD